MVFEYSYPVYMTDLYTQKFCFPHFCAQHNLYVSIFVSNFFDQQLLVERKITRLWKPKVPFAVEALFFLGVLFAVGGLERVGILKARISSRRVDGKWGGKDGWQKETGMKSLKSLEVLRMSSMISWRWFQMISKEHISVCFWVEMLKGKVKSPRFDGLLCRLSQTLPKATTSSYLPSLKLTKDSTCKMDAWSRWISFFGAKRGLFSGANSLVVSGSRISQVTFRFPLTPSHQARIFSEVWGPLFWPKKIMKIMPTETPKISLPKKMNKKPPNTDPGFPIRFRFERLWRRSSVRFAPLIPSSPGLEILGGHFFGDLNWKMRKDMDSNLMGNHGMGGDLRLKFWVLVLLGMIFPQ